MFVRYILALENKCYGLTIALGRRLCSPLPKITASFDIVSALFKKLWDQTEMHETLETDDNFEIVASTIKAISIKHAGRAGLSIGSSSACRKTESKSVRRIDHRVGDTPAKLKLLRLDKPQSEDQSPVSDKR